MVAVSERVALGLGRSERRTSAHLSLVSVARSARNQAVELTPHMRGGTSVQKPGKVRSTGSFDSIDTANRATIEQRFSETKMQTHLFSTVRKRPEF